MVTQNSKSVKEQQVNSMQKKTALKSEKVKCNCALDEKDSLQDLLNVEKTVVKMYTTAMTEGVSKGFRQTVKKNLNKSAEDQIDVFFMMSELGYAEVKSAPEQVTQELKQKFSKVQTQLS
jgi:spore coat protein CotF